MFLNKEDDFDVWNEYVKNINHLSCDKKQYPLPKKLKAKRSKPKVFSNTLDLHGFTLEEAYQLVLKFVTLHFQLKSDIIYIITGKGFKTEGKIKKEITLWFETPVFKNKIKSYEWIKSGGTLKIKVQKLKD